MENKVLDAATFSRFWHRKQRRKYTNVLYFTHPAEAAGYSTICQNSDITVLCWLHDLIEDTDCTYFDVERRFGTEIADLTMQLTDQEVGNREQRLAGAIARLAAADWRAQSAKCCDIASNVISICEHDPKYGLTYCRDKRRVLDVLTKAHPDIWLLADTILLQAVQSCEENLLQLGLAKLAASKSS